MRGYTGSQEAAKWSLSGARPVLEVLGWSPVTHEGLYSIIQAVSTLLDGTLLVVLCPGVLEWSQAPHEGIQYTKKHVLRVQVLFSVQYSTIQTSERLLNGL